MDTLGLISRSLSDILLDMKISTINLICAVGFILLALLIGSTVMGIIGGFLLFAWVVNVLAAKLKKKAKPE